MYGTIQDLMMKNYTHLVSLEILGHQASLKNRNRIIRVKGRFSLIMSSEAKKYQVDFIEQVPEYAKGMWGSLEHPLAMTVIVYFRDRRSDLSVENIRDSLQKSNVIKNDRYIVEEHTWARVDKENPRAIISLFQIK